jgi:hypothetical protein
MKTSIVKHYVIQRVSFQKYTSAVLIFAKGVMGQLKKTVMVT